jgi:phosphatidate cytidylyltransferase
MTDGSANWDDLRPRLLSAAAMALVGLVAILMGGVWFAALVAVAAGVMIWELARMLGTQRAEAALILGAAAGLAVLIGTAAGAIAGIVALAALAALGVIWVRGDRSIFLGYGAAIILGCFVVLAARGFGTVWVFWLLGVVIASDTAGYFAGKRLGGPKFWPRVSPKKTWSGTVAGWIAAAFVGLLFLPLTGAGAPLILISALVGFAGQMGDIAESAIKRYRGVKDASDILPGHGGVLDRFDGMIGAALAAALFFALGWLAVPAG